MRRLIAALPFSMLACHTQTSDAPGLEISTAALTLDGVTEACYDLAVHAGPNTASPLVWSREGVCASRFGDGVGAISYVGPCDASTPAHTVQLVLATLYAGAALDDQTTSSDPDFINPCPAPNGCTLPATCAPNTDTPVRFDLTLMRPAGQGFFDIAVDLDDVFCSAKADCASSTGPLELLHNPRLTGAPRDQTLVMGLTCTAGPDTDTRIHWLDATIVCGGVTYDLLAGMVDNTAGLQGPIEPSGIGTSSLVFEHAYYLGEQAHIPYFILFLFTFCAAEREFAVLQRQERIASKAEDAVRTALVIVLNVVGLFGLYQVQDNRFLPLMWGGLAVSGMALGALFRESRYRWAAFVVFGFAIVRAFWHEFHGVDIVYQLLGLGLLGLIVSWAYSRYRSRSRRRSEGANKAAGNG